MAERTAKGVDVIVNALRERIVSHELPPGSKLREQALSEEFAVSRPRLREAFGILEDRGLIERVRNQGAIVTRLSADKINELFEVREVMEALSVRLATEKAPKGSWDELVALFGKTAEKAVERNDLDGYLECVTQFRAQTIAAADNEILSQTLDGLYDRTKVLIRRLMLVPGRAKEGLRQHQEVLKAMQEGDAERAEKLKRENIRSARTWFHNYQKYLL